MATFYAVNLFIVLSGFCLMLPLTRKQGVQNFNGLIFLKKRAIRILPTYFIAMAVSLIFIGTLIGEKTGSNWDASIPVTNWDIISHVFLIQDLFVDTCMKINHAFWSISVEWKIYFFFPLILYSLKRFGNAVTMLVIVFFSVALWYGTAMVGLNFYTASPHYLALFSFGMLAAKLSFSESRELSMQKIISFAKPLFITSLFAVLVMSLAATRLNLHVPVLYSDLMVGIASASLLMILARGNKANMAVRFFSWKPLVFAGSFAYSIYLVHAPLLQVLYQYFIDPLNVDPGGSFGILFFLGTPVVIFLCYLFFLVAEYPFIRRKASHILKITPAL